MSELLDLLIIGAGPAGLSAADAAAREGLSYLVIEKGTIANTIRQYPVGRTMFSTPNELEMREGSLQPIREKPTREELLSHYIHFVLDNDLRINTGEEVVDVERDNLGRLCRAYAVAAVFSQIRRTTLITRAQFCSRSARWTIRGG